MASTVFQKKITLNIGIILGGIIFLMVGLIFLRILISRNALTIQRQRQEIISRGRSLESAAVLKGEYERAKQEQYFLANILPAQDQLINLPRELNFLAQQNKVALTFAFGSQASATADNPGFIAFNLVVEGTYEDIIHFIKALERSRFFIRNDVVDISEKGDKFSASISSRVFSR